MKLRKVAFLFLILGFGFVVEVASRARQFTSNFNLNDLKFRAGRFSGPHFEFKEESTVPLPAGRALHVVNEYGDVTITHSVDRTLYGEGLRVVLTEEVYASSEERAKEIADTLKLSMRQNGDSMTVGTNRAGILGNYDQWTFGFIVDDDSPKSPQGSFPRDVGVKTHIEVFSREPLATQVENRHGEIHVLGAASVNATGEFDVVRVQRVTGACSIKNRHGDIELLSVQQGCRVSLEHGNGHLQDITGFTAVDMAHGDLDLLNTGSVELDMNFVDLEARNIGGDLRSKGEHNDLRVEKIGGNTEIENRGDIDLSDLSGRLVITNRHGHVRALRVAQDAIVKNSFDDVSITAVSGPLEIENDRGGVRIAQASKGARVKASGDDVDIHDFSGPLILNIQRGEVRISPTTAIASAIEATTGGGDIVLAVPSGSNGEVDAQSDRGDVDEDGVSGFTSTDRSKRRIVGRTGQGGPTWLLRSRLGDIRLTGDELSLSAPDEPSSPDVEERSLDARTPHLPAPPAPPRAPKAPRLPEPPAAPTPLA